ncbi:MAG: NAD(P)H-hydrate dehydratase [Candidatus Rokuibacteriota bacterium]
MLPVFSVAEMRALDRRTIARLGIPGGTLMENAGRGAARAIVRAAGVLGLPRRGGRVVVVCGKGGNGGDGFVVGRHLAGAGRRVEVFLLAPVTELTGDPAAKHGELVRAGIKPRVVTDDAVLAPALARADLVVDALLGTGARGVPAPLVARAIARVNACGRPVVALDIPSGLPGDGETPEGAVVRAALTTTFAGLKRGLVGGRGPEYAGRVEVVDIGIPPVEVGRGISTFLVERSDVAALFPPRPRDGHKGIYGHLLLLAGSVGKTGAAALAARAAMRAGAGLVTVATPASAQPVVASLVLEAMSVPLPETPAHTVAPSAAPRIAELAAERDAVALGPGLGLDDDTLALVRDLARALDRPTALDADALSALAGHLDALRAARGPRVLTPHPGEMARMLGVKTEDVQRDRIGVARQFATTYGVHLVLKGATSVVASPDGRIRLNPTGNPGMASGGTGDVLTGILGAFLARGLTPGNALMAAVWLHGMAGDIAAEYTGQEALVASDVIDALPEAFDRLTRGDD